MDANNTNELARLVRQKRRLLEQLLAVGGKQASLIESGDTPALLKLLSAKQQIITAVRVTERELGAFRGQDPDARPWPSPADRQACAADSQECERLLGLVVELEQRHERVMTERRDAVAKQLRVAQSAHAASSAYQPHVRTQPGPTTTPAAGDPPTPLSASLDLTSGG